MTESGTPPPSAETASLIDLLDALETLVAQGRRVPLTRAVMVDEDELLDYVDRCRLVLPDDLRHAHEVITRERELIAAAETAAQALHEQSAVAAEATLRGAEEEARRAVEVATDEARRIIAGAQAEAERVVRAAQDHGAALVAEHPVSRAAEERAREVVAAAEVAAERDRAEADAYARRLLEGCEERLAVAQETLRRAVAAIGEVPAGPR